MKIELSADLNREDDDALPTHYGPPKVVLDS
jgi:hypothetical protein